MYILTLRLQLRFPGVLMSTRYSCMILDVGYILLVFVDRSGGHTVAGGNAAPNSTFTIEWTDISLLPECSK